jgi:hypothetical protein
MSGHPFIIGTDGGLSIDLEDLVDALADELGRGLDTTERDEVETHIAGVLRHSMTSFGSPFGLSRRVGDGRYLAVGDLGSLGLAVLLGPIAHLLAAGTALKSAGRLITFDRERRPRVVAIYARLTGVEREVFETVHSLQNEWIVTNYDALDAMDYDRAFGQVAPTFSALAGAIGPARSAEDIVAAVSNLTARRVLATDGARYWIRF